MKEKRNTLLTLLQIFEERTDSKNRLTKKQILEILKYEFDVDLEEKTFYRMIKTLQGNGYNIERQKGKSTYYYIDRERMSRGQWVYLMCLLMQNDDLSDKVTKEMIACLRNSGVSLHILDYFDKYKHLTSANKTSVDIIKNFEVVLDALDCGGKVSCKLYDGDEGYSPRFCFTPKGFDFENHRIVIKTEGCEQEKIHLKSIDKLCLGDIIDAEQEG